MFLLILFLLLGAYNAESFLPNSDDDGWENPLDSFFSSKQDTARDTKIYHSFEACPRVTSDSNGAACSSFLSRFVNIILLNTGLKNYYMKTEEQWKTVTVDISVSKQTLGLLQKFSAGEKVSYEELDDCFVSFFKELDANEKNSNFALPLPTFSLGHNQIVIMVAFLILSLIVYSTLRNGIKVSSAVVLCFLIYYVIRIGQSLWTQYEDIYAQRIVALEGSLDSIGSVKIPDECYPSRMKFWERFYYNVIANDNPCKSYLKSKKSIFTELDIEKAVTEPIYGLVMSALPVFGDSAGKSVHSFTGYFPFPLNIFLPFLIIYCFFSSMCPSMFWTLFRNNPISSRYRRLCNHQTPSMTCSAPAAAPAIGGGAPNSITPSIPSTIVNNFFSVPQASQLVSPFGPSTSLNTSKKEALNEIKSLKREKKLHAIQANKYMKRKQMKSSKPQLNAISNI